jgi:hypothetical protein
VVENTSLLEKYFFAEVLQTHRIHGQFAFFADFWLAGSVVVWWKGRFSGYTNQ